MFSFGSHPLLLFFPFCRLEINASFCSPLRFLFQLVLWLHFWCWLQSLTENLTNMITTAKSKVKEWVFKGVLLFQYADQSIPKLKVRRLVERIYLNFLPENIQLKLFIFFLYSPFKSHPSFIICISFIYSFTCDVCPNLHSIKLKRKLPLRSQGTYYSLPFPPIPSLPKVQDPRPFPSTYLEKRW